MTVPQQGSSSIFFGNGSTTTFSFPWIGYSTSYINVYLVNTTGVQTLLTPAQYSIGLNSPAPGQSWGVGGTITYPLAGMPMTNGEQLIAERAIPYTQATQVTNQTAYPASVQTGLDVLCMELQQVVARTGQIRGIWVSGVQYNFGDVVSDGANGSDTNNLYMCSNPNISGTWVSDLANGDWNLVLNVQALINALPVLGNNLLFANISGGTATPTGVALTAFIDSAISNVQGAILFRNATQWVALAPGNNGQVVTSGGSNANVAWGNAGTGTITGVSAGTGLTGGGTGGSVTVSLSAIATGNLMGNLTGNNAVPTATTLTAYIDNVIGNAQGSILYRNNTQWVVLTPGTAGQFLETLGASANPQWSAPPLAYNTITGYLSTSQSFVSSTAASTTITAGQASDSTNAVSIAGGSFSWNITNGNAINGYQGGTTLPTSSTIHFFVCSGTNGVGSFASTSLTPTLPSGYNSFYRRVFSLNTNGSGVLLAGTMIEVDGGAIDYYPASVTTDANAASTGSSNRSLFTMVAVPVGVACEYSGRIASASGSLLVTSPDEPDTAATNSNISSPGYDINPGAGVPIAGITKVTNTSGQVGVRNFSGTQTFYMFGIKFRDFRRS